MCLAPSLLAGTESGRYDCASCASCTQRPRSFQAPARWRQLARARPPLAAAADARGGWPQKDGALKLSKLTLLLAPMASLAGSSPTACAAEMGTGRRAARARPQAFGYCEWSPLFGIKNLHNSLMAGWPLGRPGGAQTRVVAAAAAAAASNCGH